MRSLPGLIHIHNSPMNTENRLPVGSTAVKKATGGREKRTDRVHASRIVTALRSLTAACFTVELLRNGSPEF
jgi:hypothetical protein